MNGKNFSTMRKSSNELPNLDKMLRDFSGVESVPPKRPEPKVQPMQKSATEAEVLLAKVVHVYKYDGGHYGLCEKLQIALIKTLKAQIFQILLYVNKQVIVSVTTITPDFSYVIQTNNYCTYQDDNKCLWSIKFDDVASCIEVGREICLCKYFCTREKQKDAVIYQDLIQSEEEQKAGEGDAVTLKYSIVVNITQPLKMPLYLDQQMIVTITPDNTWERCLCGSKRKSRKLLILPPLKQISLGPGFPKEKDIALEVEIVDINRSTDQTDIAFTPMTVKNDKSSLVSRMAKVGHSILPRQSTSPTDSEDTEDEEERKSLSHKKGFGRVNLQTQVNRSDVSSGTAHHKPTRMKSTIANVPNSFSAPIQSSITSPTQPQQQVSPSENQSYGLLQSNITSPIPIALDPNLNVFLSESRMQNAEIRMGMTRISDNVQKLLDKFHNFEIQQATSPTNSTFEALKMLMTLNPNALQNNNLRPINGDSDMTSEINRLTKIIEEKDFQLKEKERSLQNMQDYITKQEELEKINTELNKKVEEFETLQNNQTEELNEMLKKIQSTEITMEDCRKENVKLKSKIDELSNECRNLDIQQTIKEKNEEIKTIMHRLYREIMDKFTEESYKTPFINQTISSTIRRVTLEVLNERKNYDKTDNSSEVGTVKDSSDKQNAKSVNHSLNDNNVPDKVDNFSEETTNENISSVYNEEPPPIPPMDIVNEQD